MTAPKSNTAAPVPKKETDVRPYVELQQKILGRARLDTGQVDAFEIASQVVDKIAQATTLDDMFDAQTGGGQDITDYLNTPLNITDVQFFQADEKYRKGGLGAYCRVEGVTDNGELFSVATGATNVVAFMFQAQSNGFLSEAKPLRCRILGRETRNGVLYTVGKV